MSDDIYRSLGSLEAKMEANEKANILIIDGIKEIRNHQLQQNGKLDKAHFYIEEMRPDLESAFANGNDWADTKTKAKWLIGLGFLGSAGSGFSLSKFFGNLFS